jgi:two-component system phosphate regulon sensor histidine kinase PhoR
MLQGARGVFVLITLAAAVSMLALLLTVRAIRANTILASMKSDFVSGVTHELKTPLALIRLVGDTLARGRYASTETILEYATLLSEAASRLSQSIDNLLTYARYSDPNTQAAIELAPADVGDLVEGALECFMPTLEQRGFQLEVDVPPELPQVSADRPAMIQAIENVIDNAIKYSDARRVLRISARATGTYVRITLADCGTGIAQEDIGRVCDRFFRGRNSKASGSGLGLAIAHRVLRCHGGKVRIRSALNVGTEVDLLLLTATRS